LEYYKNILSYFIVIEGVDPREGDLFDRYLKQYAIDQLTDLGIL